MNMNLNLNFNQYIDRNKHSSSCSCSSSCSNSNTIQIQINCGDGVSVNLKVARVLAELLWFLCPDFRCSCHTVDGCWKRIARSETMCVDKESSCLITWSRSANISYSVVRARINRMPPWRLQVIKQLLSLSTHIVSERAIRFQHPSTVWQEQRKSGQRNQRSSARTRATFKLTDTPSPQLIWIWIVFEFEQELEHEHELECLFLSIYWLKFKFKFMFMFKFLFKF
jgi:hypothetical protein